jgi:lipopolysaccharide/colanic/teichoic acid biosynthesis glycosyltransferase
MHNFYHRIPDSDLVTRQLLILGFEDNNMDLHIRDFPPVDNVYHYEMMQDAQKAFWWLEERVKHIKSYLPPFAILCRLDWMEERGSLFFSQVKAHPDLRYVPVIVLAKPEETPNKFALVKAGVDDCYTFPVDWDMLRRRLEYLHEYKILLYEHSSKLHPQSFKVDMPFSKRLFDIIGASLGLILAAPFLALIAIAIRLESKGPILYRSKRAGAGYHIFDFLKFRSMYQDADQRLKEFADRNQYSANGGQTIFVKFANDPRITHVGRFIRKFSLDELPQLINVLKGDMSLVGNRPLPLYEAEQLTSDEWCARFLAPAGLTGLWQVTKRGKTQMSVEERIALDIQYSQNYNVWEDFKIILRTFSAFVQHEDV